MSFKFHWSPLIADTERVREMLTAALNKSPKPPIIVDDIIVTELNLGQTPPELEILEIGDLAVDKFRGIFKMSYTGDAFLTLKTKVEANPLHTYLSAKPDFASPEPLAASSSLKIPLQITLSDIRLSGFVILVFSRQKGLTLVFRNDPLESLKVSSTFDSIPFIREYLQKEIERQLRILFMEDLPAILHRLSLRLWSPDYQELEESLGKSMEDSIPPIDPLASPPQDPVDAFGNPIDERELAAVSIENPSEAQATFSAKNLLRLATLEESQRTLSLFTPSIRDAVYRAWTIDPDRALYSGVNTPLTPASLSRIHSSSQLSRSNTSSVTDGSDTGTTSSRPSLFSHNSTYSNLGHTGKAQRHRKKKHRIINLRRRNTEDAEDDTQSAPTTAPTSPLSGPMSEPIPSIPEEMAEDLQTPPRSPRKSGTVHFRNRDSIIPSEAVDLDLTPRPPKPDHIERHASQGPSRPSAPLSYMDEQPTSAPISTSASKSTKQKPHRPPLSTNSANLHLHHPMPSNSTPALPFLRPQSFDKLAMSSSQPHTHSYSYSHATSPFTSTSPPPSALLSHPSSPSPSPFDTFASNSTGGILEQAWMMKMAREIAKRVREEQERVIALESDRKGTTGSARSSEGGKKPLLNTRGLWDVSEDGTNKVDGNMEVEEEAPPAYAA
jgi:mitochondrial distribution and morphology protein 34